MKKLAFVLLLTLSGCLSTTNHHPYKDGRSKEDPWWNTPYTAKTPRDKNPWLKFVPQKPVDHWNNPWKYDDLRKYGVSTVSSQALPSCKTPKKPKKKVTKLEKRLDKPLKRKSKLY